MIHFDVQFNLDGLAENVAVMSDKVQRKAALDLFGELIQTTPIDTGRARAGWSMDIQKGEDLPEHVDAPKKWKKGKTPYYKRPTTPIPPKGATAIYIFNNVEYIKHLNDGTTTQAPRLFVDQALEKVKANLK